MVDKAKIAKGVGVYLLVTRLARGLAKFARFAAFAKLLRSQPPPR